MSICGLILEGELSLDLKTKLDDAFFKVTLEDVTMVDVSSITVATTEGRVTGDCVTKVPFRLNVPLPVSSNRRYVLRAELWASGGEIFREGDYISTVAIPWEPYSRCSFWSIPLVRV
ncbi:YbaY family lipoprotein [Methylomonas rivi]|uniref:YbaY family lipoprotein n=1 Tax=Methylomonas rivi TaxID=2952226 RepID=UPI00353245C2